MPFTALDPALLVYRIEDWAERRNTCTDRITQLLMHRRFAHEFRVNVAMSTRLMSELLQEFPYQLRAPRFAELRDFRQMLFQDLARLRMLDEGEACEAEVGAPNPTCRGIDNPPLLAAWEKLLAACVLICLESGEAAWVSTSAEEGSVSREVMLTVLAEQAPAPLAYSMPVVWNEQTWAREVGRIDWWPDVDRMVKLLYAQESSLQGRAPHPPQKITCTPRFEKDLAQHCEQKSLRAAAVEALAKLACGILDKGLGDEAFGSFRRIRVTLFYRVHYEFRDSSIVLLEFGPHDIGIKG